MKVKDIMESIEKWCPTQHPCKSDVVVYGDEDVLVTKACVCCIATCDVIRKAKEWGAQLIITHEPTYHPYGPDKELDPVNVRKKELIESTGISILRLHDHLHFTDSDKIIEGVLKKLGWDGVFDGNKKFTFNVPKTVNEIQNDFENRLELKNIRVIGNANQGVKNISMCVGSWGTETVLGEFSKHDTDAVVCGEISEWQVCEHARDAVQLGFEKSFFVLGHMGSERSGMEYVCEYLMDKFRDTEFKYIDCEEVYR